MSFLLIYCYKLYYVHDVRSNKHFDIDIGPWPSPMVSELWARPALAWPWGCPLMSAWAGFKTTLRLTKAGLSD